MGRGTGAVTGPSGEEGWGQEEGAGWDGACGRVTEGEGNQ